ncbi:MAG: hypothetical protein IPQ25_13295 [Chitinophagaceae bacterium]|nr:hypothetical protein [Chitinophagaceae bacterium]
MKTFKYIISALSFSCIMMGTATAQNQPGVDSTGLPGDDFSLQGALQMFQDAATIEDFEKAINTEGNHINNLDLNADGEIDYIRVVDKSEKDVHAFVLQVPVSETENQDIAVIELEKTGEANAIIQIIGDEDIYGEQVIVEPDGGGEEAFYNFNDSKLSGPNAGYDFTTPGIVVNVWLWPSVRFVYGPAYRPWISPWRWRYYPGWWKPWKPLRWHAWHPFRAHYHRPFSVVRTHRVIHAHRVYTPFRTTSVTVRTRNSAAVGNFRVTRTKTSITGPRGKTTTVKKTTVTGPRGGKATKVKARRH